MLGVISQHPDLMQWYFPQTRMYYSKEDLQKTENLIQNGELTNQSTQGFQFSSPVFYYEGFVRLYDEGYVKSLYLNSLLPFDEGDQSFFYLKTKQNEAWILLLVKALAKYFGSY